MQERVWGRRWGVENDVGRLRLCVLHRPGDEMRAIDPTGRYDPTIGAYIDEDEQWYWRDSMPPDLIRMQAEHDALAAALRAEGVDVVYVDCPPRDPHAVFTRDMAVAVKAALSSVDSAWSVATLTPAGVGRSDTSRGSLPSSVCRSSTRSTVADFWKVARSVG